MTSETTYQSQSARDAQARGYGNASYWDYLDRHAIELADKYRAEGDETKAREMMTRTLGESLAGNDGD